MEILKNGKYVDDGQPYHIDCDCGCKISVFRNEILHQRRMNDYNKLCVYFYIQCPQCKYEIIINDPRLPDPEKRNY